VLVLLTLGLLLVLSGYVVSTLESVKGSADTVNRVYAKQQGYHALLSLLPLVTSALSAEDRSVDTLLDPWSFPLEVETERGALRVAVVDEDRFLNLNAVRDPRFEGVFRRLLEKLGIDPSKADLLKRWLRERDLKSVYDLLHLGFSEEEVLSLRGLVTVWSSGRINVNTAPREILRALDPEMDDIVVERLLERRSLRPFRRVEDLVLVEGVTFDILYRIRDLIGVRSRVFRIEASAKVGDAETSLEVVYDREAGRILFKRVY
jgi:general secretion pathway protein K